MIDKDIYTQEGRGVHPFPSMHYRCAVEDSTPLLTGAAYWPVAVSQFCLAAFKASS
mgnify:CR=1 FL=1